MLNFIFGRNFNPLIEIAARNFPNTVRQNIQLFCHGVGDSLADKRREK